MKVLSWYYIGYIAGLIPFLLIINKVPDIQYYAIIALYAFSNIIGYYEGKNT